MGRNAGYAGEVTQGGGTIAGIKSWTLDHTYDALDGRGFDDSGAPHPVAGCYDWSGSFEGYKDGAPVAIGSEVALVLKETQTATQKWSGQALITGRHAGTPHDGLVTISYDFTGSGALTPPSA